MVRYLCLIALTLLLIQLGFSKPEGQILFEENCLKCHGENSRKPLSYLKREYKGKPDEIKELAKRCPWARNLSDKEIDIISKWLAGVK